jgi:hypothetical protein
MTADATEELAKLRRRMGRALRRKDTGEYERLAAVYADLKGAEVERAHRERREASRARRAAQRAAVEAREDRWRLPYGFSSPLAAERARSGVRPQEEPAGPPRGGLRPWRRGWSPMSEVIWRPGD